MHIPLPLALLALATSAVLAHRGSSAGSGGSRYGGGNSSQKCLDSASVNKLVDGYTYLLEHPGGPLFNSTAGAILSDASFTVESDSILTLSQRELGQPAYPSKAVFIATQFQTPPLPVVETLDVFAACDKISWRWTASGIGSDEFEINGIIVLEVDVEKVQITTVYSEFNTAAFQADLGQ